MPHNILKKIEEREKTERKFTDWYIKEIWHFPKGGGNAWWMQGFPVCPDKLKIVNNKPVKPKGTEPIDKKGTRTLEWKILREANEKYHPGAKWEIRSKANKYGAGQQCCYDKRGKLITRGLGVGTPDRYAPFGPKGKDHRESDVEPYVWARKLDGDNIGEFTIKYFLVRRPSKYNWFKKQKHK